ncbi:hypothetical protein KEM48_012340 [Puccinia striiformis f. sp. tritici PST-130]|nr:hypothetical protein KEM48_012340 [Puccinia striiformis f. sp. tritici PST-130]
MWNHEYQNGHEFPFSLVFNNAAKNRAPGRPPAPEEMMATASALGTISLPITNNHVPRNPNGIFALAFSGSDKILGTGSGAKSLRSSISKRGIVWVDYRTIKALSKPSNSILITIISFLLGLETGVSNSGTFALLVLILLVMMDRFSISFSSDYYQNAHDEKFIGKKRRKGVNLPSVSSVLWSRIRDHQLYSAGSSNGVVKLWDIRKKTPFSSKAHPLPLEETIDQTQTDFEESGENENPTQRPHGISSLVTSQDGARLYTLGTDSVIRTHDGLHLSRPPTHQLSSYKHPQMISTSLYLKLSISQDDRFLANSTSTGQIFIWDTSALSNSDPVILDNAHSKEICGLDFWNNGLGSCSDDSDIKIWSYSDTQFLS